MQRAGVKRGINKECSRKVYARLVVDLTNLTAKQPNLEARTRTLRASAKTDRYAGLIRDADMWRRAEWIPYMVARAAVITGITIPFMAARAAVIVSASKAS
jgi:hypothetical protein